MRLAAFFHVWADGAWQRPLAEFQDALADFDEERLYGLVGSERNRDEAWQACPRHDRYVSVAAEADTGYESVTLNALRGFVRSDYRWDAVLYAHTKGAHDNTPFRDRWRRSMLNRVVVNWRANLDILATGDVDAIGCHWLTEAENPGMFGPMTVPAEGSGFFGGNFWMARTDYLRTLPECDAEPRWQAESWVGIGRPRVVDLLSGWPQDHRWPELCG